MGLFPREPYYFDDDNDIEIETDPYAENSGEMTLEENVTLTPAFRAFANVCQFEKGDVLHACCSVDTSAALAFQGSRVIHVDIALEAIAAHKKVHHEGYVADAKTFVPPTGDGKVDILILVNPEILPVMAGVVRGGGYVLCNDYHATATHMHDQEDFEMLGMLREREGDYVLDPDVRDYVERVQTEEELGRVDHGFLEELYELLREMHNETAALLPTYLGMLQEQKSQGTRFLPELPRKKRSTQEIFVFQKKKQEASQE